MNDVTSKSRTPQPYAAFDRQLIAGEWKQGGHERFLEDRDPYTGEVLVKIRQANRDDMEAAYVAAAQAQPAWAAKLPMERSAVMLRAVQILKDRRDEVISWLVRESGSTRMKATLEWQSVQAFVEYAAFAPYQAEGGVLPADVPAKEGRVYRKPVGVVGVISPWNWPLQLSNRSVAPALAVGNAVVIKPASDTPITGGLLLGKIFEEAGLPPGVLSIVIGPGSEIGDAFVMHAIPRVISFTGSTSVGRHIGELATKSPLIKRTELELGGNCPFVVLEDADMPETIEAALWGKFLHQGQICMSVNRFIIDELRYDEFVERFVERVKSLKYGNPDDADTMIGPIINESQLKALLGRIQSARDEGAQQVLGGNPQGQILPPHVFVNVMPDMRIATEEIFGPVAPIIRARGDDDALRIANATSYGLSGCVFTGDLERGAKFAQKFEIGMVHVNDQTVNDLPNHPFGGEKNSGIGRFNGKWAIDAFTTEQLLTMQHRPRQYPFDARAAAAPLAGVVGG
jgi:aldehyde dehydrogenase (NAD+)